MLVMLICLTVLFTVEFERPKRQIFILCLYYEVLLYLYSLPPSPISWDLCPCQDLFGDNSVFSMFNQASKQASGITIQEGLEVVSAAGGQRVPQEDQLQRQQAAVLLSGGLLLELLRLMGQRRKKNKCTAQV